MEEALQTRQSKAVGRPSSFTQEIADRICGLVATSPQGIRRICEAHPELPNPDTIYAWIASNEKFSEQYARAKEMQLQSLEDEMLEIADDGTNDYVLTKKGPILDKEAVMRSNLRIETRKWLMMKLRPKKYGDRVALDGAGALVQPLVQINVSLPSGSARVNPQEIKPEFEVIEGE